MGIFIEYYGDNLSHTEKSILSTLDHNPELIESNLTDLAEALHSSGTSIIRLCHKIGFSGFSEFKFEAKKNLNLKKTSDSTSFLKELKSYCDWLSSDLIQNKTQDFARQISKSKSVYIAGVEASKSLAEYFSHKLNQLDYAAVCVSDDTLLDLLPNLLNRQSLVIYISISGQTKRLINSAQKSALTGANILSITNAASTPLSLASKMNISTNNRTLSYHNYDITPRTFQVVIIDMILEKIFNNLY